MRGAAVHERGATDHSPFCYSWQLDDKVALSPFSAHKEHRCICAGREFGKMVGKHLWLCGTLLLQDRVVCDSNDLQ